MKAGIEIWRQALKAEHNDEGDESSVPDKLVYVLAGKYKNDKLRRSGLRNCDKNVVNCVEPIATAAGFQVVLASIEHRVYCEIHHRERESEWMEIEDSEVVVNFVADVEGMPVKYVGQEGSEKYCVNDKLDIIPSDFAKDQDGEYDEDLDDDTSKVIVYRVFLNRVFGSFLICKGLYLSDSM